MTLQLEELPFELDGKTYLLRCNMAVLEAVQEAHEGNFAEVLEAQERGGYKLGDLVDLEPQT